jgi:hypothetical protein
LTPIPEIYILYQAREKGTVTVKCPQCDFKNPDDTFYCGKCGASLQPIRDISVTKTLQTPARGFKKAAVIANKYKIIGKLGEGGMGIVYKVKDTKLDRTVALKFLSQELTRDRNAKKRFIQEAKAAAALNHPQICTIYEVDEADGQTFISMEYIEGWGSPHCLDRKEVSLRCILSLL